MAGARGEWNSRFGFIMAAVGSAVGLGNLVRFPKELADNGGAAFMAVYLVLLLLVGLPAILGEMTLGKIAQMSPVNAFRKLGGKNGRAWAIVGVAGMLAGMFVLFFYTVMTGWTLRFFFESFADGWFDNPTGLYEEVAYGPMTIFWHAIVTIIVIAVVSRGISGGIERATTFMMPTLFAIVLGIVIFALVRSAQTGDFGAYSDLFRPSTSELSNPRTISKAVGQVFFSLSLGQGAMLTYASYMERKQSVTKDGTIIAFADTGVALLGALMVFPVLSLAGLLDSEAVASGSFGTAFIALPNAFVDMGPAIGRIVGTLFFLGLFFAAFSSAISLIEVPVSVMIDNFKMDRTKATIFIGLITYTFGVISSINEHWFLLYDEIAVNVFIVAGVAVTTAFAGWIAPGVGKELDAGLKSRVGVYVVWTMRTITPLIILTAFLFGALWGTNAAGDIVFWHGGADGGDAAGWRALWHEFELAIGRG